MKRWLPWIVITIFVAYVGVAMFRPAPSAGTFDADGFGRLPMSLNGRVQPIDSAARLALLHIHGSVTLSEERGRSWQVWKRAPRVDATEWLLEVLTKPDAADSRTIFRINDAAVRAGLQMPPAGAGPTYHSLKDLEPRLKNVGEQVNRISSVKPADRTAADREWLRLRNALVLYERLKNSLQPNSTLQQNARGQAIDYNFGGRLARYEADLRTAAAATGDGKKDAIDKTTEARAIAFVRPYGGVARAALLSIVPPTAPERGRDRWLNAGVALLDSSRTGLVPAPLSFYARMSTAYESGKADEFNRQLASYRVWLSSRGLTAEVNRARTEFFYNRVQPLVRAVAIYLVVLLLGAAALARRSAALYRCAAMLLALGAVLHGAGILFDMMLQGTLPVTNVYSGIILGGGISVLIGAVLERRFFNGVALVAAAIVGFSTLVGAHSLAPGGARALAIAVLDTPFVAAIVVVIAIGLGTLRPVMPRRSFFRRRRGPARAQAVDLVQRMPAEPQT